MTRGWDAQTFQRLGQIPVQFYSVALSPDGQLVVGQTVNGIEVWDWADAEPVGAAGEFDSSLWHGSGLNWSHALAVSLDGQHVAAYANQTSNTAVSLWRVATGERVATLTGPTAPAPLPAGRLRDIHGSLWWRGVGLRGLAASSLDGTAVWPVP